MSIPFTKHSDTTLTDLGGGVSRRILSYGEDMMAVEVSFKTGAIGAKHTHRHVQISYVLEGEFEATVGNTTRIIGVGDTYYTLPDVEHGVVCLKEGKLLDIFTPQRTDFLK